MQKGKESISEQWPQAKVEDEVRVAEVEKVKSLSGKLISRSITFSNLEP